MKKENNIIFQYGAEGGGATVYQLPNGKVIEKGSSGDILDEEEDPIKKWEHEYDNWYTWWEYFTNEHKEFWICFSPIFIHNDIKESIRIAVDNYVYDSDMTKHHKNKWYRSLEE